MEKLQSQWTDMYRTKLPALAKQKDQAQQKWPVVLDHCFARIILDNAVGKDRPWAEVVKSPATKNMTEEQIRAALDLGNQICAGEANLQQLDQRSLSLRGKTKGGGGGGAKRKGPDSTVPDEAIPPKKSKMSEMADIWEKFSAKREDNSISNAGSSEPHGPGEATQGSQSRKTTGSKAEEDDVEALEAARRRIQADASLSTYRKHVLTLLTQVPRSRFTTYKELSNGCAKVYGSKSSNARAIGGAMRNNPFAPVVPCHRVLASDGKLGGFKGDWGEEGRFAKEKRRLLREEGVKFDGGGKVVGQPFTGFFKPD